MNKTKLRELLTNTICDVTFTKTDGTIRNMAATLMAEHLPIIRVDDPTQHSISKREENPKILAVWDMDKNDWRSFRLNTIVSVSVVYPAELKGLKYASSTQE